MSDVADVDTDFCSCSDFLNVIVTTDADGRETVSYDESEVPTVCPVGASGHASPEGALGSISRYLDDTGTFGVVATATATAKSHR